MSVLIKGMEMPQDGNWITVRIHPDGSCFIPNWQGDCTLIKGAQADPVPPHGRLIDADALMQKFEQEEIACDEHGRDFSFSFKSNGVNCAEWWYVKQMLEDAPTIIEAEEGERMHDELVKRLRNLSGTDNIAEFDEAADAIEELSKQNGRWEEAVKTALDFIPRWIPVTERLPEENGNYLVAINCPRGKWDEICAFDGRDWVSVDEYAEIATKWVTHWMPLPEPPKEEN